MSQWERDYMLYLALKKSCILIYEELLERMSFKIIATGQ